MLLTSTTFPPIQVGKGQTVRTPFVGESLTVRHRHHKAGRSAVHVQAAIATQRLKVPKAIKQGTQKIAAAAKKAAPKKSGTQPVLKPLVPRVSGTQIKKAAKVRRDELEKFFCCLGKRKSSMLQVTGNA